MSKHILLLPICLLICWGQANAQVADSCGFFSSAANNAVELLRGKVSGVRVSAIDGNPSGVMNVYIRGLNSLRSDNQPLYIVDGTMVSNELNDNVDAFWQYGESNYTVPLNPLSFLAPSEIESIEVLKDISATALYGSRGANGVVIINTKKRTSTSPNKNFSFSANSGVNLYALSNTPSILHNYRAAVDGASGKAIYNISATFRHHSGNMARMHGNYGSLKANFNTQANKVIWFGFNALLSVGKTSSTTGTSYFGAPSYTLALRDPALSSGISLETWKNNYDDDSMDYRALASSHLIINLAQSLRLKTSVGIDFQDNSRYIWYGDGLPLGQKSAENVDGGAAAVLTSLIFNYNANIGLEFKRYLGNVHLVTASAGAEAYGFISKYNTMNMLNFATHELRAKGLNLGNSPVQNRLFPREYSHLSWFATAEYKYEKIAGVNLSYRMDWTPKYKGLILNHYPAVNVWTDLQKALFKDSKVVSSLRIKGGWGISGKEKYIPYELFGNYLTGGWYTPEAGTEAFYDGMDRLLTKEYNVGAEATFLADRLSLGIIYYDRVTSDSFQMFCNGAKYSDADYWGWKNPSLVFDRVSSIANKGFEFDIKGMLMQRNNFKWSLSANLSYNINRMISSNPEDFAGKNVGKNLYCTCNTVGLPVSSLFGYKTDENGNLADVTGEGIISVSDKVVLGSSIPAVFGGLQTVLTFGNFRVEVLADGAAGHKIANVNNLVRDGFTDSTGQIALTGKYVEKGDFLRLSEVGIGYTFPFEKVKWIKGLDLRLSGHNLATITSYSGWSPDVNVFGISALANGYDYGSFPSARSLILGVSLLF